MLIVEAIRRAQVEYPVNLYGMCQDLGIRFSQAWLDDDVSGELVPLSDGSYQINVNAGDPIVRQRFTTAHELGHYALHRHLIGRGIDDDRAYRSTSVGRYYNTRIGPREETEANRFAANLLMPEHLLATAKKRGLASPKQLAEAFLVSLPAMRIRMGLPPSPSAAEFFEPIQDD
jgi:Zn-dependent peptidase ImmA (M78 family)